MRTLANLRSLRPAFVLIAALTCIASAAAQVSSAPGTTSRISPARNLQDEVFYFFMPIAWRAGHGGIYGDFKGMTDSLPYLKTLAAMFMIFSCQRQLLTRWRRLLAETRQLTVWTCRRMACAILCWAFRRVRATSCLGHT